MTKTSGEAQKLLEEWVQNEALRRHMYAVEAAMRAYAKKYGEDENLWGITGLLHDFDYEKYPHPDQAAKSGHPFEGVKVLEGQGYPPEMLEAILGHAIYSGVPRTSKMAKTLFAVDELCGFIVAVARMRPTKLEGMEASSVKKKLKDKSFAEKVSREDIELGIIEMEIDKDEHINFVIKSLQPVAQNLGL